MGARPHSWRPPSGGQNGLPPPPQLSAPVAPAVANREADGTGASEALVLATLSPGGSLVASRDPAITFELAKEVFDQVAFFSSTAAMIFSAS
jgi:hypothetical protein